MESLSILTPTPAFLKGDKATLHRPSDTLQEEEEEETPNGMRPC